MDPLEFLRLAGDLSGSAKEAEWRTSIGRSYFAVFNHVRARLAPLKPLPTTGDVHSLVIEYLTFSNIRELASVGQTLRDLRTDRNQADYEMDMAVDQTRSRTALLKAERAIEKSTGVAEEKFRAAIIAQPVRRREPNARFKP